VLIVPCDLRVLSKQLVYPEYEAGPGFYSVILTILMVDLADLSAGESSSNDRLCKLADLKECRDLGGLVLSRAYDVSLCADDLCNISVFGYYIFAI
jgi:hypothetical protein